MYFCEVTFTAWDLFLFLFAGGPKNTQWCLRGVGPHKGFWETDAVAEDAEKVERAGAPSARLLTGTHTHAVG